MFLRDGSSLNIGFLGDCFLRVSDLVDVVGPIVSVKLQLPCQTVYREQALLSDASSPLVSDSECGLVYKGLTRVRVSLRTWAMFMAAKITRA